MATKTMTQAMLRQAVSFATASRDIFEKYLAIPSPEGKAMEPFIVNAALSIEIYLKTLHANAGARKKEHGLLELYDALPKAMKEEVDETGAKLAPQYEGVGAENIRTHLARLDEGFGRWQEVYESGWLKPIQVHPTVYLMHVLHEVCKSPKR
jgi:hypothetical protein